MGENREFISVKGITKAILLALGVGAVIGVALVFPGIGYVYKELDKQKWQKLKKRGQLGGAIKRLEKQKLISWKEQDGNLILTLTNKGKKRIIQYKLDDLQIKKNKRDGLWRIIVFDIPERNKQARDFFRGKLKQMGLYQLQESVFYTPYECKDEIDFLRYELGVEKYVIYILAKEISRVETGNRDKG